MIPRSDIEDTVPSASVAEFVRSEISVADVGGCSEQGAKRLRNEDAWGHRLGEVFVVADGIGGRRNGDVASRSTVDSLLRSLSDEVIDWREPMRRASHDVMAAPVSSESSQSGSQDSERRGPGGAVAVALRCFGGRTSLVHVGDARAYRIRNGLVEPLTRDHSVGEAMAELGVRRNETGLPDHELASITSFFGGAHSWEEFTVRELTVRTGDRIVLATDGCYRHVARNTWTSITGAMSAGDAAAHLVERAVEAGATDDATAMVVDLIVDDARRTDRAAQ